MLVTEICVFITSKDCFLSPDKCPGAISRRRLALKLSFNCQHPLWMNDLEHSWASSRHPRRHLLIGSLCATAQCSPLTLLCARTCWPPSAFDRCTHASFQRLDTYFKLHLTQVNINNYIYDIFIIDEVKNYSNDWDIFLLYGIFDQFKFNMHILKYFNCSMFDIKFFSRM